LFVSKIILIFPLLISHIMIQTEFITAPKVNTFIPYGMTDKLFTDGALYFNKMEKTSAPLCKCGCGKSVVRAYRGKKWNTYIDGHNRRGTICSEEQRKKISENPYRQTPEYKEKQRIAQTGRKHSEETKRKISEANKGRKLSKETRKKQSIAAKKRGAPQASLEAMWKSTRGTPLPAYRKQQLSEQGKKLYGGSGNPNWQGGISFLPYGPGWTAALRRKIKERDNYICQNPKCKNPFPMVDVHHIDYDKENNEEYNLITLCKRCHGYTQVNKKYWIFYYQNTTKQKIKQ